MDWETLVPLAVAVVGLAGGYLRLNRKLSGRINTSEAAELWKESTAIRDDYRKQLGERDQRIATLHVDIRNCEEVNEKLRRRVTDLETARIEGGSA
jgi:hypothetical protein